MSWVHSAVVFTVYIQARSKSKGIECFVDALYGDYAGYPVSFTQNLNLFDAVLRVLFSVVLNVVAVAQLWHAPFVKIIYVYDPVNFQVFSRGF